MKCFLILILALAALFPSAAHSEAESPASARTYAIAAQQYERGDVAIARVIFAQCGDYEDSLSYIALIDAKAAVSCGTYADAIDLLGPLARAYFRDTPAYLRLVKGMYAEAEGDIPLASLYYTRLGVQYDAVARLIALQVENPDWFPSPFELPEGAAPNCRALLMRDGAMVFSSLESGGLLPSFPARTELRVLSFVKNPIGTVFACVLPLDAPAADAFDADLEAGLAYIEASILYYMHDVEE